MTETKTYRFGLALGLVCLFLLARMNALGFESLFWFGTGFMAALLLTSFSPFWKME